MVTYGAGEDSMSASNNIWQARLMTTIGNRIAVSLVCWDGELVTGKRDGEVFVVKWRHARVVGNYVRSRIRSATLLPGASAV